jgi:type II secretory ATPase GspE/PulE/Tfp pilus assembly ATPase PilB-like protein
VRRLCEDCITTYTPDTGQVAALAGRPVGRTTLRRGTGCPTCRGTGFRGRLGLFELLLVTDAVKDAIATGKSRAELRAAAVEGGMVSLREDGWRKVQAGLTTVEEVFRVVQE